MKPNNIAFVFTFLFISIILSSSCKKYLDKKSDESITTPETIEDVEALLDYPDLNKGLRSIHVGTDEFYLKYADWLSRAEIDKDAYIWNPMLNDFTDWEQQYRTIFYANTAKDYLDKIGAQGQIEKWNRLKGTALFFRAHSFYLLSQLYSPPYNNNSLTDKLGIPLRLSSDFNSVSQRSTLKETYDQIANDLKDALILLPEVPLYKTRPSKPACFALLARIYLLMGEYANAKQNADQCLKIQSDLLDFNNSNDVKLTNSAPIAKFNREVIFESSTDAPVNSNSRARVDSLLVKSFQPDDLRAIAFLLSNGDGTYKFKGSYDGGSVVLFNGIATDEIYLIRAETSIRLGEIEKGISDLTTLLTKRWTKGKYVPATPSNEEEALKLVFEERKKEMIYRGTRWSDLRRKNLDTRFQQSLRRDLNGQSYELPPNDNRYTLLLPREVILQVPLIQNPR